MSRSICPKCITGKVSYQLAKLKSGRVVLVWYKCSSSSCTHARKGDESGLTDIDYYYKINKSPDLFTGKYKFLNG